MSKFTPGPWKLGFAATSDFDGEDKKGRPIRNKHIVWQSVESVDGSRVATTSIYVQAQNKPSKRISSEESVANANLIAAAPEIYKALKNFDPGPAMHFGGHGDGCAICIARAALAKADGTL